MQDLTSLESIEKMPGKPGPCAGRARHQWEWAAPPLHFAEAAVRREECPHCFRERFEIAYRGCAKPSRYRYPGGITL